MAKLNTVKQLEVLIAKGEGLEWMVLAEEGTGKELKQVGATVVQTFKHERGDVTTTFNLNNYLATSVVR